MSAQYWFPGRRQKTMVELRKRLLADDANGEPKPPSRTRDRLRRVLHRLRLDANVDAVAEAAETIARLTRERNAAQDDAAHEHERAEAEYETVDAVAAILTEIGRPDEEEIADGVRWLVNERDRLARKLDEARRDYGHAEQQRVHEQQRANAQSAATYEACQQRDEAIHDRDVARVMVAALAPSEAGAWKDAWEEMQGIAAKLERERDEARTEISRLRALLSGELSHGPLNVQGLQAAKILEVGMMLSKLGRPDHEDIADGVRWLVAERDRLRALLRECEWSWPNEGFQCPVCGAVRDREGDTHAPDCRLKAALEG